MMAISKHQRFPRRVIRHHVLTKVTKQPKHGVTNLQNKTDKFSGVASDRFKSHAIETHRKSERHRNALEAEMIARMSMSHRVRGRKRNPQKSVLKKAFSAAYFSLKEYLPNRKFLPLIKLYNKCDSGG